MPMRPKAISPEKTSFGHLHVTMIAALSCGAGSRALPICLSVMRSVLCVTSHLPCGGTHHCGLQRTSSAAGQTNPVASAPWLPPALTPALVARLLSRLPNDRCGGPQGRQAAGDDFHLRHRRKAEMRSLPRPGCAATDRQALRQPRMINRGTKASPALADSSPSPNICRGRPHKPCPCVSRRCLQGPSRSRPL